MRSCSRDGGLKEYLARLGRQLQKVCFNLIVLAEWMEMMRECLMPPPCERSRKGKLSSEAKDLLKRWKAEVEAD